GDGGVLVPGEDEQVWRAARLRRGRDAAAEESEAGEGRCDLERVDRILRRRFEDPAKIAFPDHSLRLGTFFCSSWSSFSTPSRPRWICSSLVCSCESVAVSVVSRSCWFSMVCLTCVRTPLYWRVCYSVFSALI